MKTYRSITIMMLFLVMGTGCGPIEALTGGAFGKSERNQLVVHMGNKKPLQAIATGSLIRIEAVRSNCVETNTKKCTADPTNTELQWEPKELASRQVVLPGEGEGTYLRLDKPGTLVVTLRHSAKKSETLVLVIQKPHKLQWNGLSGWFTNEQTQAWITSTMNLTKLPSFSVLNKEGKALHYIGRHPFQFERKNKGESWQPVTTRWDGETSWSLPQVHKELEGLRVKDPYSGKVYTAELAPDKGELKLKAQVYKLNGLLAMTLKYTKNNIPFVDTVSPAQVTYEVLSNECEVKIIENIFLLLPKEQSQAQECRLEINTREGLQLVVEESFE